MCVCVYIFQIELIINIIASMVIFIIIIIILVSHLELIYICATIITSVLIYLPEHVFGGWHRPNNSVEPVEHTIVVIVVGYCVFCCCCLLDASFIKAIV